MDALDWMLAGVVLLGLVLNLPSSWMHWVRRWHE